MGIDSENSPAPSSQNSKTRRAEPMSYQTSNNQVIPIWHNLCLSF